MAKNLPATQETCVRSLGLEDPLEEGMATHSSILGWTRIPRTEDPGGIRSVGSQRVGHDWVARTAANMHCNIIRVFVGINVVFYISFLLIQY